MIHIRFHVSHADRHRRGRGRKARWAPFLNSGLVPYCPMRLRCEGLIVEALRAHD